MKSKWYLIASVFELIIGIVAVVAFVILGLNDENMIKWIAALALSLVCIVLGIVGIKNYVSDK